MAADFWTWRFVFHQADRDARRLILLEAIEALRAKGCTFFRASHIEPPEICARIFAEGWIKQPADQGPCDHDKFDVTRLI